MRLTIAALALAAALTACGSGADEGDATGQEPTPTPSPSATPSPTGPPWPAFPHQDYTFVYAAECFCGYGGVRIEVTVEDGQALRAVRLSPGKEHGEPVTAASALITMDDVIALADTPDAAEVQVDWPAGQDYPDRVWVDRDLHAADEELGYRVYRVQVAD